MMRALVAATLATVLAVPGGAPRADGATPHARLAATELTFDGSGMPPDRLQQTVPVYVEAGWTLEDVPAAQDVSHNGRHDVIDRTVTVVKAAGGAPALVVRFDPAKVRPGSYRVALTLTLRRAAKKASPADRGGTAGSGGATGSGSASGSAAAPDDVDSVALALALSVAAPAIDTSKPVQVEIVECPFLEPGTTATPLTLDESTGHAGTGELAIHQHGSAVQNGKPGPGALTVQLGGATGGSGDPGPGTLGPRGHRTATITATGFPLGASDATVRISGDDLAAPIDVPVHVVHRRGSWLILVLFVVGVGAGFGVRSWAKRVLDREVATDNANEALDTLRDLARRSRPEAAQELADAARKIYVAAGKKDAAKVNEAVTKAEAVIAKIRGELTTQLQGVRTQLLPRAKALALTALPPEARAALKAAAPALTRTEAALIHGDVVQAEAAVVKLDEQLGEACDAVRPLSAALIDAQRPLDAVKTQALATVRPALADLAAQIAALADALEADRNPDEALVAADQALRKVLRALRAAAGALSQFTADVRAALDPTVAGPIADAARFDPGDGSLVAMMAGLRQAIAKTHLSVLGIVQDDAPLVDGDFLTALRSAARAAHPDADEIHLGDTPPGGARRPVQSGSVPADPPPPDEQPVADMIPPDRLVIAGTSSWLVRSAKAVQLVATIVILPAVAWYLYSDAFIGTGKEIVAIGATGFLTDASLGGATTWLGKLARP